MIYVKRKSTEGRISTVNANEMGTWEMARMVYKKGGCLVFQMQKRDSNLKLTRKMMGTMQRRQMQTRKQEQVLWWFFEGAFQCNFNSTL